MDTIKRGAIISVAVALYKPITTLYSVVLFLLSRLSTVTSLRSLSLYGRSAYLSLFQFIVLPV